MSKRRMAASIVAVWLVVSLGCAGSPASRFYVLAPAVGGEKLPAGNAEKAGIAVGLRRVALPAYLDRPQIVTRVSSTKLDLSEFHRWAAPLRDAFANVLAENLAVMIPTERVTVFPWPRTAQFDYEITIDVTSFEGRLGGMCDLIARWSVFGKGGKELLVARQSSLSEPAGESFDALISAQSRLVTSLSREIVGALNGISDPKSRAQAR
jgi:uncharacterized protein